MDKTAVTMENKKLTELISEVEQLKHESSLKNVELEERKQQIEALVEENQLMKR